MNQHETSAPPLRASAGRRSLDPTVFPTPIAGHGSGTIADRRADPLELNGVLLSAGERRCLLLSFDLLYVGGPLEQTLRSALFERHGLARADVLLFASHTHFAPPTDPTLPELGNFDRDYAERVTAAAIDLTAELFASAGSPCRLEIRRGMLAHAVNRRRPRIAPTFTRSRGWSFDRVSLAPHASGPRDETATIVHISQLDSADLIAILWHYACHPVGRVPANVTSADFPGIARQALRRTTHDALPVLYLQGFCGNIRPNLAPQRSPNLLVAVRRFMQSTIGGTVELRASEASWQAWAESFAAAITDIAHSASIVVETPSALASASEHVGLNEFFDGTVSRRQLHLWALRIGSRLELYAFGAEPSIEWQTELNAALGQVNSVRLYCAYCGDVFGYLPVPAQLAEGGYEVSAFQRWFGMAGKFDEHGLRHAIVDAVRSLASMIEADASS